MIGDEWAKAGQELGKAGQEIGKATGKGIDAAQTAGGFFGRFLEGPLEQASGILTERLKFIRWEGQLRLAKRAQELLTAQGLDAPTRQLPFSVGVPLIEAGSLEAEDSLRELWAQLLASGADDRCPEVRKAFVSILTDLTAFDALVLRSLIEAPADAVNQQGGGVYTIGLPDSYVSLEPSTGRPAIGENGMPTITKGLPQDTAIALWNLVRLGCIVPSTGWHVPSVYSVSVTSLGRAFIAAVTQPNLEGARTKP